MRDAILGPAPRRDLVAGLTVGAVVVPQSLAYAELAGLPPVAGLYAALAAMVAYALLGSSPHISLGPTATSAILAAAAGTAAQRDGSDYATVLAATAVIAGAIAMAGGVARLGFLANLLSRPVLTGYTAGAAVIIAVGQIGHLLGIKTRGPDVGDVLADLPDHLGDTSFATVVVGVASIGALVLLPRLTPRVPAVLVVVAVATLAAAVFDLADHGVAVLGHVPGGLPSLAWPGVSAETVRSLLAPAAALALVGFAENVGQARAFERSGEAVDGNRELLATGAANVASGLSGGFAVSSSFSRNAVNIQAGGRTRRAGLVTAGVVAVTLVALTGLLEHLPMATLAAIIVVAVLTLIRVRTFRRLARLQRDDFVFALIAAGGTVVLGVLPGLALAVALSIGGLLYRVTMADTAVLGYVPEQDTWRSLERFSEAQPAPGVVVFRFSGPLYFANMAHFRQEIAEVVAEGTSRLHRVVIDARGINHLDVTALDGLADLHARLATHGIALVIANLRGAALDTFLRSDLVRDVGQDQLIFPTVRQAVHPQGASDPPGRSL